MSKFRVLEARIYGLRNYLLVVQLIDTFRQGENMNAKSLFQTPHFGVGVGCNTDSMFITFEDVEALSARFSPVTQHSISSKCIELIYVRREFDTTSVFSLYHGIMTRPGTSVSVYIKPFFLVIPTEYASDPSTVLRENYDEIKSKLGNRSGVEFIRGNNRFVYFNSFLETRHFSSNYIYKFYQFGSSYVYTDYFAVNLFSRDGLSSKNPVKPITVLDFDKVPDQLNIELMNLTPVVRLDYNYRALYAQCFNYLSKKLK